MYIGIQEIFSIIVIILFLGCIISDLFKKTYKNIDFVFSVVAVLVLSIATFIVSPSIIKGESMMPTLEDGQIVWLNKSDRNFDYGDIVILKPSDYGKRLIKRIVAKEGDSICMVEGILYINGVVESDNYTTVPTYESFEELIVPKDSYFVMGDNRPNSLDSRNEAIGFIEKSDIIGKI